MKRTAALVFSLVLIWLSQPAFPVSMAVQSYELKGETIGYLRQLEPMVSNFGTVPKKKEPEDRFINLATSYRAAQQSYTIAIAYLYEKNYIEALTEFRRCQVMIEKLLEKLSQEYVDRARDLVRDATSSLHPNGKNGVSVMEITVKYGPKSQKTKYFRVARRAPQETRFYSPLETHLARDMQKIENNLNMAYTNIGDAVGYRNKAITIEHSMETHQKVGVPHRRKRIDWYLRSINLARKAKRNGINIFIMKYPYENLAHQLNKNAKDEKFEYDKNHWYLPRKLHPVFDERIPKTYRRDAADAMGHIFNDEYSHKILQATWQDGEWMNCDANGKNCKKIEN